MFYTTLERMRAEGLPVARASDDRVNELIEEMSREIDFICGWWFYARQMTFTLDGRGKISLWLPAPPIRVDELLLEGTATTAFVEYGEAPVQGSEKPLPRLERSTISSGRYGGVNLWPIGQRNIELTGAFGYTDEDGTDDGRTPFGIRRACEMMVLRWARRLDSDADERWRGRLISQRTNRQSMTLSSLPSSATAWDQDPEISRLLARYRRPAQARVV